MLHSIVFYVLGALFFLTTLIILLVGESPLPMVLKVALFACPLLGGLMLFLPSWIFPAKKEPKVDDASPPPPQRKAGLSQAKSNPNTAHHANVSAAHASISQSIPNPLMEEHKALINQLAQNLERQERALLVFESLVKRMEARLFALEETVAGKPSPSAQPTLSPQPIASAPPVPSPVQQYQAPSLPPSPQPSTPPPVQPFAQQAPVQQAQVTPSQMAYEEPQTPPPPYNPYFQDTHEGVGEPEPVASQPAPVAPAPVPSSNSQQALRSLTANMYAGIGNKLFVRGEGGGLTWERGQPMHYNGSGQWTWSSDAVDPLVRLQVYQNDQVPCSNGTMVLHPGDQLTITPSFPQA